MKYVIQERPDHTHVVLAGSITEGIADVLHELANALKGARVRFDLAKITHMNSLGASHWSRFVTRVGSGRELEFENCSSTFADYALMLPSLTAGGRILSLSVPFYCSACDKRRVALLQAEELLPGQPRPGGTCPTCKAEMTSEVPLEEYEAVVKR